VGKAAMLAHLQACVASRGGPASSSALLVRAQAGGAPAFWLDLAVKPEATLKDVDALLRRTWLECCGHLSEFYSSTRQKVSMSARVGAILGAVGTRVGYVYDFGSSTELVVSHGGVVEAALGKRVRLVARNEPPTWSCGECGEAATQVCGQCACEGGGFCCPAHTKTHECGEEMLLPVVNSPRMGVCGYTGEA
jgi:hypothetical protein